MDLETVQGFNPVDGRFIAQRSTVEMCGRMLILRHSAFKLSLGFMLIDCHNGSLCARASILVPRETNGVA